MEHYFLKKIVAYISTNHKFESIFIKFRKSSKNAPAVTFLNELDAVKSKGDYYILNADKIRSIETNYIHEG